MRPSQSLQVLEDLFSKRTGRLQRKGVELSLLDTQTTREVYQQWLLLNVDLGYLSLVSHRALLGRIVKDMLSRDVFDVVSALNACVDNIRYQRKDGFEAHLSAISTHLPKVYRSSFDEMLLSNVAEAKRLNQVFSYTSRLTLQDIDLTDQCLDDYLATEQLMMDDYPSSLIKSVASIVKRWMLDFDPSDLRFQHGPGGVAGHGRTTLEVKYKDLWRDDLINEVFGQSYYTGHQGGIVGLPTRISQTIFVPKSYKAFRTISMEPTTLMYLQQGVWREIDRVVSSSRYLKGRIDFHDQTRNQKLAREGSISRNYATIDLSAASDSVSWELVCRLFGETDLFPYLEATRSTQTLLPNGQLVDLKKFAPMGSALCFPIETIIFAAVCEHSCRKMSRVRGRNFTGDYSVFGDDIIVPSEVTDDLVWSLLSLGFSVNSSKSFTNPKDWFRESCGGEYCDGYDVTPLRVSRKYSTLLDDIALTGCIELSNACYRRGFKNLRAFFLRRLFRQQGYIPMFGPTSLLGANYSNWHTKTRFHPTLQRNEAFSTILKTKTHRGDEEVGLRHWLETCDRREGDILQAFDASVGRSITTSWNRYAALNDHFESGHEAYETEERTSPVLLNNNRLERELVLIG